MHNAKLNFSNFVIKYLGEIETDSKILYPVNPLIYLFRISLYWNKIFL